MEYINFLIFYLILLFYFTKGEDVTMPRYDTIVIGLGAAGTAAASTLAAAGRRVLAVEAQNRIGGRVMTVPFGNGLVELGAEWIHGTEKSVVYEAATKASVALKPQELTLTLYRCDGSEIDQSITNELVTYALSLDPPEIPRKLGEFVTEKIKEYLKKNYPSLYNDEDFLVNFQNFLNYLMNNYDASNDWNDVTTASKYTELGGHQHMSWHLNGYRTLFDILLKKYNNDTGYPHLEIKLNTEVENIAYGNDDKVHVKCKNGGLYTADNVIVTVSLGVLKERYQSLFTPSLPHQKVQAIKGLSIGVMDKVILEFNERWWPQNATFYGFLWNESERKKLSDEDLWITKIFAASTPMGASNVLTMWTSGETAKLVETLPEEVVITKCMALLRKFMGKNCAITEPIKMIRSTWYANPFTKGSYTYDAWGAPNPTARAQLLTPILDANGRQKVLFAGEATNPIHFSTVHGAVESGIREAMRLLPTNHI